jgi:transcriptional regulator with XRE-family HTH domain
MPQSRVLDPGSSLLAFFGAELRRRRAAAGMSQEQLGHAVNYSAALVGRVEIGERVPSPDFARRCDDVLSAEELFAHLRDSMNSDMHAFPRWFREFVEHEGEATSIREFNALAVPGLLQTEDYARALIRLGRPRDSDDEVGARRWPLRRSSGSPSPRRSRPATSTWPDPPGPSPATCPGPVPQRFPSTRRPAQWWPKSPA